MISPISGLDDFREKKDDILSAKERKSDDFMSALSCCSLEEFACPVVDWGDALDADLGMED